MAQDKGNNRQNQSQSGGSQQRDNQGQFQQGNDMGGTQGNRQAQGGSQRDSDGQFKEGNQMGKQQNRSAGQGSSGGRSGNGS